MLDLICFVSFQFLRHHPRRPSGRQNPCVPPPPQLFQCLCLYRLPRSSTPAFLQHLVFTTHHPQPWVGGKKDVGRGRRLTSPHTCTVGAPFALSYHHIACIATPLRPLKTHGCIHYRQTGCITGTPKASPLSRPTSAHAHMASTSPSLIYERIFFPDLCTHTRGDIHTDPPYICTHIRDSPQAHTLPMGSEPAGTLSS
jgi:hypothetical protein